MMSPEEMFHKIGSALAGAERSQMFGKPCYKIGGKAFVCFYQMEMVFKLTSEAHAAALLEDGARLFDPSSKGRPMKEWVQMPHDSVDKWSQFAEEALSYVAG